MAMTIVIALLVINIVILGALIVIVERLRKISEMLERK